MHRSVNEQIAENSRQIKHAVFFVVILLVGVIGVACWFYKIGQDAKKADRAAESQRESEETQKKIDEFYRKNPGLAPK